MTTLEMIKVQIRALVEGLSCDQGGVVSGEFKCSERHEVDTTIVD
jgi:hypothetical protein